MRKIKQLTFDDLVNIGTKERKDLGEVKMKVKEIKGLYDLPGSWRWVKLGDIVEVLGGGTPSKSKREYWGGNIPWVSPKDMEQFYIYDSKEHITPLGLKESSTKLIPENSILIVFRSSILLKKLPVAINRVPVAINQDLKALIPKSFVYPIFLGLYLLAIQGYILERCRKKGVTVQSLEYEKFVDIPVPLPFKNNKPDLEEQKRIVAKIEELFSKIDRIRELRRQAKEEAENLLKVALHHVFSRADKKGWRWVRFGEILYDKPQYGLTARSTKEIKSYRYLRISDIDENGDLRNDDPRYLELEENVAQKYLLHENDVLIARSGSVGRVYIHRIDNKINQKVVFASYLIRFPIDREKVEPKFFFYYGLSPFYWKQVKDTLKTVAQPNINAQQYQNFKIPLPFKNNKPDLEEQKRIAAYLDKIAEKQRKLLELYKQTERKLEMMKQAILSKAFRGEL